MTDEPRPIADSLAFVTRDLGLARPGDASQLVARWGELVGDALAQHTRPAHIRDGVLTVEVEDGAWGAPLKYLGDTLVARANEVLDAALVTDLRIIVKGQSGPVPRGSGRAGIRPVSGPE